MHRLSTFVLVLLLQWAALAQTQQAAKELHGKANAGDKVALQKLFRSLLLLSSAFPFGKRVGPMSI